MGKKYRIPSYEEGGIIPETGIYKLHEGEEVVSKRNRLRQKAIKKFPGDKKAQNGYMTSVKFQKGALGTNPGNPPPKGYAR